MRAGRACGPDSSAFTSTDENLNKAHVRYLESKPIALAEAANLWELENSAAPGEPPLSEADRAAADWFLDEMLLIYPILGVAAFEAASTEAPAPDAAGSDALSSEAQRLVVARPRTASWRAWLATALGRPKSHPSTPTRGAAPGAPCTRGACR
jgi:hypothetical protein